VSKYTRKVRLEWTPKVQTISGQKIRVETGSWHGETRYEATGELSIHCAVQLVRELRRALRKIRDEETARLEQAVTDAEGGL
jgi:hypothetical protein